jgi:hypothetical protein
MAPAEQIQKELLQISALLGDRAFAVSMASSLNAAYEQAFRQTEAGTTKNTGETRNSGSTKDATASPSSGKNRQISVREQKIAINLAGFYAVECGIGLLITLKGGTPESWLEKIVTKAAMPDELLVLSRFANATWKAGQPFRGLDRIKNAHFISANFLSEQEAQKDTAQVMAAALKLRDSLREVKNGSVRIQLKKLQQLLRDKQYAREMAGYLDAAYHIAQKKAPPLFLTEEEEKSMLSVNAAEEQTAISIAGFYALECGLSYLAASENKLPSEMLSSIVHNSLPEKEQLFFERLANATWKAGQPFRGLDRITRPSFIPAAFLSEAEIEKDRVQIRAAAQKLLEILIIV